MRMVPKLLLTMLLATGGGANAFAAPMMLYSQDGKHYLPLQVIAGNQTAKQFYDYRDMSGHPAFGAARATASTALYWDQRHNILSLIALSGSATSRAQDRGDVTWKFQGLPWSTYLSLCDDTGETAYDQGASSATARFQYKNSTDGLVLGGLQRPRDPWVIKITIPKRTGVRNWRLVDGDVDDGGQFLTLALDRPLYLKMGVATRRQRTATPATPQTPRSTAVSSSSFVPPPGAVFSGPVAPPPGAVPEPGGLLGALGLLLLFAGRGRR